MTAMIGDSVLDDDPKSGRNQSLSSHAQSFVENWNNFPVNVLFSVLETAAPVLVTLTRSIDFPVGNLTISGAVGPLLAATAQFGTGITNLEAKGTMPYVGRTNTLLKFRIVDGIMKDEHVIDLFICTIFELEMTFFFNDNLRFGY